MYFDPLSEQEIQTQMLLPDGIYSYQVIKSEDKPSKSTGKMYTAITLKVWDNEGKEHIVYTNMALIKLIKHFCDVNNMQDEYSTGCLPPESFMHKSGGKVVLEIETEKPNPNGGMYKAKNVVKDYIAESHGSSLMPLGDHNKKDDFINDDLPF